MDTMFWRDILINVIANLVSNIIFLIVTPIGIYLAYKVGLRQGKSERMPLKERFVIAVEAVELAEKQYPGSGQGPTLKHPWAVEYYRKKTGASEEEAIAAINDAFIRTIYPKQQNNSGS